MNKNFKNFLKGIGNTAFDIGSSNIRNPIRGSSDSQRLKSDWCKIGNDMKKVMSNVDERKR